MIETTVDAKHFCDYSKRGKSEMVLVAEMSDIRLKQVPQSIRLTGDFDARYGSPSFGYIGCDERGGDVQGWKYRNASGAQLLIIND